jgi:hypothetical protein
MNLVAASLPYSIVAQPEYWGTPDGTAAPASAPAAQGRHVRSRPVSAVEGADQH